MNSDLVFIPHAIINPSSITTYTEVIREGKPRRRITDFMSPEMSAIYNQSFLHSKRTSNGTLSDQSKRKLGKAIEYLVTTSTNKTVKEKIYGKTIQFKISFTTLTLPAAQIHKDSEIINTCLNSLLNELRQIYRVKNYVWRAERQQNGNIHFHILTDKFIPWNELKNRWNRLINKLGYVDRFQQKHGFKQPNSTDIHSTRKVHNLKKYLLKYFTKSDQESENIKNSELSEKFQSGRLWGCNQELGKARGLDLIIDNEIDTELKKITEGNKLHIYKSDYFTVTYIDYKNLKKYGSEILFNYFTQYLFDSLGYSEQIILSPD